MNEQKLRKNLHEELKTDTPELWDRILDQLPEKNPTETVTELSIGVKTAGKRLGQSGFWRNNLVKGLAAAAALVLIVGVGGAAASNLNRKGGYYSESAMAGSTNGYAEDSKDSAGWGMSYDTDAVETTEQAAMEEEAVEMESPAAPETSLTEDGVQPEQNPDQGRKLIFTYDITLETLKFDELLESVQNKIREMGGYVESSDISGNSISYQSSRSAYLNVRIPRQVSDDFRNQLGDMGNIRYSSSSAEDITLRYSDTKSRIETLKKEQQRLLAFMDQADNMSDLIEIERRLSEISYELESFEGRIRTFDNQIEYDTIYLSIQEVKQITPQEEPGFFQRIGDAFVENVEGLGELLQDSVVFAVSALPYLAFFTIVIILIRIMWKRFRKY